MGITPRLKHLAATGFCKVCAAEYRQTLAVAFAQGQDANAIGGVCEAHAEQARKIGYHVEPDPWAGDGLDHDHSACPHERMS